MERFKTCLFNDDYLIGDNGTVKSTIPRTLVRVKDGVLKGAIRPDGYKMYWLNGKWYYAHRLVAMHFISNPHKWVEVNHWDGNKINNHYKNLEWTTRKLNQMHMVHVLGKKTLKGISHWSHGKPISDKSKKLMSEAKIGVNHPKFKGYYCYNGIEYATPKELVAMFNSYHKQIKKWCLDGINGFSFKPVTKDKQHQYTITFCN